MRREALAIFIGIYALAGLLSVWWSAQHFHRSRERQRAAVSLSSPPWLPDRRTSEEAQRLLLEQLARFTGEDGECPMAPFQRLVRRIARRYGVDWRFALAVMETESGFDPWAVSHRGAAGLMQLLPSTASLFGSTDLFDPEQNIRAGIRYLVYLLNRYHGDVIRALAAYNAGPTAVDRWGGVPPYPETQRYVRAVLNVYDRLLRTCAPGAMPGFASEALTP